MFFNNILKVGDQCSNSIDGKIHLKGKGSRDEEQVKAFKFENEDFDKN